MIKYYLSKDGGSEWKEVTRNKYIQEQNNNGFTMLVPIASWGRQSIKGKIEEVKSKKKSKSRSANS